MTQKSLTFDECKQLSSRIIAMNPNRRANMGQISSHLLDYYTELTKQPWLAQLVGQIRDLTAQQEEMKAGETYQQLDRKISDLKKQLPFRSPHYFHFLEDHRAQKFIDPEAFTFQTTVDIDNPEEVEPAVKNALLLNGMFDEPTEKLFREKIFSAEDIELWKGKVLHKIQRTSFLPYNFSPRIGNVEESSVAGRSQERREVLHHNIWGNTSLFPSIT